jgi:hypothetical protein
MEIMGFSATKGQGFAVPGRPPWESVMYQVNRLNPENLPTCLLENAIFQLSELKWNVKACLRRRQRNIFKIAHGKAKKGINGWHEANEASG